MLRDEGAAALDHLRHRGDLVQRDHQQAGADIEQMLVGVVEAGDHGAAPGIDYLTAGGGQGPDLLVGAHRLDEALLDEHRLGELPALLVDVCVDKDGCHGKHTPFVKIIWSGKLRALSGQAARRRRRIRQMPSPASGTIRPISEVRGSSIRVFRHSPAMMRMISRTLTG